MTAQAEQILEKFRQLPSAEQRELSESILREITTAAHGRKTIADIAGKYRPLPSNDASDHDRGFAEAIAASKL